MSKVPSDREQKIRLIFAYFCDSIVFSNAELDASTIEGLHRDVRLMSEWNVTWQDRRADMMGTVIGARWCKVPYLAEPNRFIDVHDDWWQHFKWRWFPSWALRRWPVKWRTYEARTYADPRKLGHLAPDWPVSEWYRVGDPDDQ